MNNPRYNASIWSDHWTNFFQKFIRPALPQGWATFLAARKEKIFSREKEKRFLKNNFFFQNLFSFLREKIFWENNILPIPATNDLLWPQVTWNYNLNPTYVVHVNMWILDMPEVDQNILHPPEYRNNIHIHMSVLTCMALERYSRL